MKTIRPKRVNIPEHQKVRQAVKTHLKIWKIHSVHQKTLMTQELKKFGLVEVNLKKADLKTWDLLHLQIIHSPIHSLEVQELG